ncbi:hypothetical protein LWI29_015899 [Acer saccharum]|uniref:Uncharacterized protein n=1 Tax=Acer saccharum TaxID=4024 RepID=A0AA39T3B2_ACESA|nr:hypothetical protein LWI29_015899 [Acer saccharum]
MKLSLKVEKQLKESRSGGTKSWFKKSTVKGVSTNTTKNVSKNNTKTEVTPRTIGKQEMTVSSSRPSMIRCFKCQGLGHIDRKIISLVEEVDEEALDENCQSEDEGPKFDKEITYGDQASSLASRRSGLVNCFKIGVRYSSRIVFLSNKQNKNYYNFGSLKHVDSVYDIRNLLNVLEGREVKFSPRDLNSLADGLAKLGSSMTGDRLEWDVF